MSSCILNVIRDNFPKHRHWKFVIPVACVQFSIGLVYLTPVDFLIFSRLPRGLTKLVLGWPVHNQFYGFFRCFLYRDMSSYCRDSVIRLDLWSEPFMQRYRIHAGDQDWLVLENMLGTYFTSNHDRYSMLQGDYFRASQIS